MNVLMTGSSGLIGTALTASLTRDRHVLRCLRRGTVQTGTKDLWNPIDGTFSDGVFDGIDAVVHLAGENIAAGRWTAAQKARIRDSRVGGTRHLCEALAGLASPPGVLVAASATGFYGDRGAVQVDESARAGAGFLPEVCQEWEDAAAPARERGIRVVHLRLGIVLTPLGGALAKMLLPFRLGLGGVIGTGEQYMSWVALDELERVVQHVLASDTIQGPVNAVAPNPVTNRVFTKTLGRVLRRPTVLPMPAFAARAAFGEMADALLLASARVEPAVLLRSGFSFELPALEAALRHVLFAGNSG